MIDLTKFCRPAGYGYYGVCDLSTPWSRSDYTYASDGSIMVEVSRLPDVPERDDVPDVARVIKAAGPLTDPLPLPEIDAGVVEICDECDGHGAFRRCPDCRDSPPVCPSCGATGWVATSINGAYDALCNQCFGTGKPRIYVRLSKTVLLQIKYIRLIASLPNARLAFHADSSDAPLPFVFDGGRGWVMQVRPHVPVDIDLAGVAA